MPKSLIDNWEFLLFGQGTKTPFRGYVSSIDPTTAGLGVLIGGSQNTYKSLLGTVRNRSGLKLRGPADSTIAGVKSSFEWETSLGLTRVLWAANGKLQVEYDNGAGLQWYDLLTGLADDEMAFSFTPWFSLDLQKDELVFVNGQQELNMWPGGIAAVASAAATAGIIGDIRSPNYAVSAPWGVSSGGIGYLVGDEITVSGGNGDAILVVDSVSDSSAVASVSVNNGGSSYTVGDIVKVSPYPAGAFAILQVTSIGGGGAVTGLAVLETGIGYAVTSAAATTNLTVSGSPSGLTVNIVSVGITITAWHFKNNGSGYSTANAVTTSGGTGIGATVAIENVISGRIGVTGDLTISQLGFPGTLTSSDGSNSTTGGTFMSGGTTYSYFGIGDNGFSFVGVSVGTIAPGDVATALVVTTDTSEEFGPTFYNQFVNTIGNQVYVGSYDSRVIYISSSSDYTDFVVPAFRNPGDPDVMILDSNARGVTSKTGQKGNALVFGSLGDSYAVTRQVATFITSDGVSAFVYENVLVDKSTSSDLSSPLGQDFLDSIGDTIIFLDGNNQLRQYGTLRNLATPVYPFLSLDVYTELASVDFTGGALRAVAEQSGETVYITAPATGALYIYQIRYKIDDIGNMGAERVWQPPFIVSASRMAVIDGVTYVYSNANPQMYQLWNTGQYTDDSPSGEQIPYESHAVFAYLSLAERAQEMKFDKIYFEGYMSRGTELYNNVYQEYQGAKNVTTVTINKPTDPGKTLARFYSGTLTPSLGDVSLGQIPLGEGVTGRTSGTLPKFRAVRGPTAVNMFECAFDVFSVAPDSQWELLCLGANLQSAVERPVQLTRKN